MQSWRLPEIETPDGSRSPVVLHSSDEGRAVLIGLEPGQELGDHQVKEHAFVVVVDGTAQIESAGETLDARCRARSSRSTRRATRRWRARGSEDPAILAPWPGEGHYRGDDACSS